MAICEDRWRYVAIPCDVCPLRLTCLLSVYHTPGTPLPRGLLMLTVLPRVSCHRARDACFEHMQLQPRLRATLLTRIHALGLPRNILSIRYAHVNWPTFAALTTAAVSRMRQQQSCARLNKWRRSASCGDGDHPKMKGAQASASCHHRRAVEEKAGGMKNRSKKRRRGWAATTLKTCRESEL